MTLDIEEVTGEPEPLEDVLPLSGPAVGREEMTLAYRYPCNSILAEDNDLNSDLTAQLYLFDPNGNEVFPRPQSHWVSNKARIESTDVWTLTDPAEGEYTCKADYWAWDYYLGWNQNKRTLTYLFPTGEITTPGGWSDQQGARTAHNWYCILTPNPSNFGGRRVTETDGGSTVDSCHYTGSPIAYWSGIQTQSGDVDSGGGYTDLIGLTEGWVSCYRGIGPGCYVYAYPCQVETDQNNLINRPGASDYQYKTTRVKAGMESN